MSRYLLPLLFVLLSLRLFAQPGNEFTIQRINTDNGLPSNGIAGLQWDEATGFLWIATGAGVARYNGMHLKIYKNDDDPHLTIERMKFMLKNNEGKIYTIAENNDLFYVQKNTLKFREKEKRVKDSANIYISLTASDQLYRAKLNLKVNSREVYYLLNNTPLPWGDTAMFLVHGRLQYYSLTIRTPVDTLHHPIKFTSGFKCDGSLFLIDSTSNVFHYDGRSKLEKILIEETDGILKKTLKPTFLIWQNGMRAPVLLLGEKAWTLSYKNGKLIANLICNKIPADELIKYAQYDEKTKTLFLGTSSRGLIIIKKKQLESIRNERRKANEPVSYFAQLELSNGNILTNEGQVLGKNISASGTFPIKGKFSNTFITADSVLWINQMDPLLGYSCLHSYDYHTGIRKTFPKIRSDPQLGIITLNNQLYLTKQSGIYRLKADSLEALYIYPEGKKPPSSGVIKEIAPGVLAIACCNAVLRFNTSTKKLDTIFTSPGSCVRTIWQYKDYLFFGTYGDGVFAYKNGIVKPLPLDKNKYLLYAHCFVEDDSGYCWISTNRGLFKTLIPDLTEAFEKNSKEVYYHYYGRNDGMEMSELNGGCDPCALLKKDKTLSFPSMDGLLWVDPLQAQTILPAGEIYIDQVIADNRSIDPDSLSSIKLAVNTDEITVRLGISAWTNKENLYLWYKLDNKEWRLIDIEKGLEIRLNNLSYGKHHLYIKKRNGFGTNNYSYKELVFRITAPWYRRWWFYLLATIAIAGLSRLFFKWRTRHLQANQFRLEKLVAEKTKELQQKNEVLEKNDTIKTRLISIISHDIITPLKFVAAAGKKLSEKRKEMPDRVQDETISEMTATALDLQFLSTNILNWIKYQNENRRLGREHFNLHELAGQVIGLLRSIAKQKQDELLNNVDEQIFVYEYLEPLKIVIYNLILNAINFTEKGKIIVGAKKESGTVVISVSDEGIGMSSEKIQNIMADQFIISSINVDNKKGNGLGYLIIKDLLKMMEGTFNIQSERGKGTTVSISIYPSEKPNLDLRKPGV